MIFQFAFSLQMRVYSWGSAGRSQKDGCHHGPVNPTDHNSYYFTAIIRSAATLIIRNVLIS